MDLFILLGSGLLGAFFMSSQALALRTPMLRKLLVGCASGGVVYLTLFLLDRLPTDNTMGALFLLCALGGIAGILGILLFQIGRWIYKKRKAP